MSPTGTGERARRGHRERSRARAWALQVHYRWEAGGGKESFGTCLAETLEHRYVAEDRRPYLRRLIEGLDAHRESVDRVLEGALENWSLDRLGSIDRGVLRIAAVEMLHFDDVPPKVSVQEAVRLAERYGGDDSAAFVNGVLDAVLKRPRTGG